MPNTLRNSKKPAAPGGHFSREGPSSPSVRTRPSQFCCVVFRGSFKGEPHSSPKHLTSLSPKRISGKMIGSENGDFPHQVRALPKVADLLEFL